MLNFCRKPIMTRSKYGALTIKLCYSIEGHTGKCEEYPYLSHLRKVAPKVRDKIIRDATNTTGAAWGSDEAGPNRILRWVMLHDDAKLEAQGIRMGLLKPVVVAKLREKAASYQDCMSVAQKLTWLVYQMPDAPLPPADIRDYLESIFGPIEVNSTTCGICKDTLSFKAFSQAKRGRAVIETGHLNPRMHNSENICFAHRECNIAQGSKTLDEFYKWIRGILHRVGKL